MDKIALDVSLPVDLMKEGSLFGGRYSMWFSMGYDETSDELLLIAKFSPVMKPKDEQLFKLLYSPWIKNRVSQEKLTHIESNAVDVEYKNEDETIFS